MKLLKRLSFFALVSVFLWGCSQNDKGGLNANLPPETDVFISTRDTLNQTASIQKISWDGRDPDGVVIGFYYTWKENPAPADWEFTKDRTKTFPLEILGNDTTYIFQIKAVDDDGAEDPSPAVQRFPIKNTAPTINWTAVSRIPDTTFTVATFIWTASDIDGDNTIDRFEYTLDGDSANWKTLPGYQRSLTLNEQDGLTPGDHSFSIRAIDIAGAKSPTIRMPQNPDNLWHVKAPKGRYLLIDDFQVESSVSGSPDAYYKKMMNNVVVPKGENFSYWNIEDLFPASTVQFKETISLFDRVIWYTDISQEADEHFIAAQVAIPAFLNNGGKIIYTTMFTESFGTQGDPLAFSPVKSLEGDYRCFPGNQFLPQADFNTIFPDLPALPDLKVSKFFAGVKSLVPKAGAVPLYRFDDPSSPPVDPLFVILGRNDNTGQYDFVFSATPLHQLNGNNNLDDFFDIILNDVFK